MATLNCFLNTIQKTNVSVFSPTASFFPLCLHLGRPLLSPSPVVSPSALSSPPGGLPLTPPTHVYNQDTSLQFKIKPHNMFMQTVMNKTLPICGRLRVHPRSRRSVSRGVSGFTMKRVVISYCRIVYPHVTIHILILIS